VLPIFAVPDGSVRSGLLTALTMSSGVIPATEALSGHVHHDLTIFAARRRRQRDAGDGASLLPDAVNAEV